MQEALLSLSEGDRISAEVEETITDRELIVGYRGNLLRVTNSTGVSFKKGDRLDLVVIRREPFELQLYSRNQGLHFDRFV